MILSWHLGIPLAGFAGSTTGSLDARKLWVAWSRGDAVAGDTFDPQWDFWAHTLQPIDDVRADMSIVALEPGDAAHGTDPDWYHPTA